MLSAKSILFVFPFWPRNKILVTQFIYTKTVKISKVRRYLKNYVIKIVRHNLEIDE